MFSYRLLMVLLSFLAFFFNLHAQSRDETVKRMIDSVSADRLTARIDTLQKAGGHLSRANFTPGLDSAVEYVRREFAGMTGLSAVRLDTFYVPSAQPPFNMKPMFNIAGIKSGNLHPEKKIVIGAHIDACGSRMPEWALQWDTMIVPGADDNASGVSVVLELARIISDTAFGFSADYTIEFVAYGVEETGPAYDGYLYGSASHAQQAKTRSENIVAMLSVDMVGFNDDHLYMNVVTNDSSRWISTHIIRTNEKYGIGMTVAEAPQPYTWSDHASFWENGFPAVCLIEGAPPTVSNPLYTANTFFHTAGDTLGMLNGDLLRASAQVVLASVATISEAHTAVRQSGTSVPSEYDLEQNHPNPFNPSTTIGFMIPVSGIVTLKVFDLLGREAATVVNEEKQAGRHTVKFYADRLPSGTYYYQMISGSTAITKKMVLQK